MKKSPGARGIPKPFSRQPMSSAQFKAVPAPFKPQPSAPAVYRPQTIPKVLQRKLAGQARSEAPELKHKLVAPSETRPRVISGAAQNKSLTPAQSPQVKLASKQPPAIYRPLPLPRVMQTKQAPPRGGAVKRMPSPLAVRGAVQLSHQSTTTPVAVTTNPIVAVTPAPTSTTPTSTGTTATNSDTKTPTTTATDSDKKSPTTTATDSDKKTSLKSTAKSFVYIDPKKGPTAKDLLELSALKKISVGSPVNMNTLSFNPDGPSYWENYSYTLSYSGRVIAYLHAHYNTNDPKDIPTVSAKFDIKGPVAHSAKTRGDYIMEYAPKEIEAAARALKH